MFSCRSHKLHFFRTFNPTEHSHLFCKPLSRSGNSKEVIHEFYIPNYLASKMLQHDSEKCVVNSDLKKKCSSNTNFNFGIIRTIKSQEFFQILCWAEDPRLYTPKYSKIYIRQDNLSKKKFFSNQTLLAELQFLKSFLLAVAK